MFTQAWQKYLPVIRILMKRSATGPQKLETNRTDFERAAGGRKIKFNFAAVTIMKGKLKNLGQPAPVARELLALLQQDPVTKELTHANDYELHMDTQMNLHIKNVSTSVSTTAKDELEEAEGGE